jgi:hypothetical protein
LLPSRDSQEWIVIVQRHGSRRSSRLKHPRIEYRWIERPGHGWQLRDDVRSTVLSTLTRKQGRDRVSDALPE